MPSTDRGRETADRIIDAAAALFYERGVRATGLDQISEVSRTGKGQIYHYFVDKADLVLAVIEHQTERVLQSQEPLLSTISTWNELDEWLALLGNMPEAPGGLARCPLGSLVIQLAEEDPAAREALAGGFDRWAAKIEEALERIQSAGALDRRADCARIARGALATYEGGLLLAEAQSDLAPLHAALATARDALTAYARAKAGLAPERLRGVWKRRQFGAVEVDQEAREVHKGGEPVRLTRKEFELLSTLMSHPRRVFSRDELMDRVSGATGLRSRPARSAFTCGGCARSSRTTPPTRAICRPSGVSATASTHDTTSPSERATVGGPRCAPRA